MPKRDRRDEYPTIGVAALIIGRGKLLAAERLGNPGKGRLVVPVGSVRYAETPERALQRQVSEEIGITVEIIKRDKFTGPWLVSNDLDPQFNYTYHYITLWYACRYSGIPMPAGVHAEKNAAWRWYNLDELSKLVPDQEKIGRDTWLPLPFLREFQDELGML